MSSAGHEPRGRPQAASALGTTGRLRPFHVHATGKDTRREPEGGGEMCSGSARVDVTLRVASALYELYELLHQTHGFIVNSAEVYQQVGGPGHTVCR
ncbi:hypothetical protein EYF80_012382 [Liparis tanakae]|uniref:Uncharacterized protein n=1 Tax=Liparis tanakae TaxID=230148 RepID=A0A4Z2IHU7_9TELE|nr:hypothetical protein EYF80_012382 [Liparis tanakae]